MSQAELSSSTEPARPTGLRGLKSRARGMVSSLMLPLMQRAARSYVGGEQLSDALTVADRLAGEGISTTLGFWDVEHAPPRRVADQYLLGIEKLATSPLDSYLSIKPPALQFDAHLAGQVATAAQSAGIELLCDSHGPEIASPSRDLVETMLLHASPDNLGMVIPGRWLRSLEDADWAVERGIRVRVVKGQWPDPAAPDRDLRQGFLEVIDRLAGRARHVRVASHDVPTAAEAIRRLRAAGTSCELELLLSLPTVPSINWARQNDVNVRLYVPYGKGYIPYAINQLQRNPRIAWWIVKNLVTFKSAEGKAAAV